ncbi:voltage-gated potassium channel [Aureococcus anophagefferens]|nr:voltage-gated potassium channel [Aureococcus anophagefferens]
MGAVAASKVFGDAFVPGALTVRIGGRVSDVLGLGDCVFPALVAGFAKRYDAAGGAAAYFRRWLRVGCVACEFAPGINAGGVPALVVLLPAMIAAVLLAGAARGELPDLFAFAPEDGA